MMCYFTTVKRKKTTKQQVINVFIENRSCYFTEVIV